MICYVLSRGQTPNIMNVTPSLPTCQALAEAGFPQNTVLSWGEERRRTPVPQIDFCDPISESSRGVAAPLLSELLVQIPTRLDFAVPHPILGSVARAHTLQLGWDGGAVIGYHLVGAHETRLRTEHANPVEAAAQLYLSLHAAGRLLGSGARSESPAYQQERIHLAKAA